MDHNLIESEKWGSISTVVSGPDTLLQSLATQTQTWTKVSLLNYIYESKVQSHNTGYGTLTCENGNCKISTTNNTIATNVRARVITNEELKDMVKEVSGVYPTYDNYYPISKADESIGTTLSWLLENTKNWSNSGATDNVYGNPTEQYWTLSTLTDYNSLMFSYYGDLKYYFPSNLFGIRPVIEIEKSKLS